MAATAMGTSFSGILSASLRAGAPDGISPIGAVTMYDFRGQMMGQMFAISLAVFIGTTAVVSLRKRAFPSWFGWVSVLITIGLLTPIAYFVLLFALIWLLAVSIWLYIRGVPKGESPNVVEPA